MDRVFTPKTLGLRTRCHIVVPPTGERHPKDAATTTTDKSAGENFRLDNTAPYARPQTSSSKHCPRRLRISSAGRWLGANQQCRHGTTRTYLCWNQGAPSASHPAPPPKRRRNRTAVEEKRRGAPPSHLRPHCPHTDVRRHHLPTTMAKNGQPLRRSPHRTSRGVEPPRPAPRRPLPPSPPPPSLHRAAPARPRPLC